MYAFSNEPPDIRNLRKTITLRYGYATFLISLVLVLAIPLSAWMYDRFLYNYFSKFTSKIQTTRLRSSFLTVHLPVLRILLIWTPILFVLSVLQTYNDLHFLGARLGRVATYCLPTVFFLTLRPSPLPDILYLSLIPIHKWLSRLVVLLGLAHSALYAVYMASNGTLYKLLKFKNLTGIIATIAFTIIIITSLPFFRRKTYNFFYVNHYVCSWIIVVSLYFHARPGIPFLTALNVAILAYQIYYRLSITKETNIDVVDISANIQLVMIPNSAIANKSGIPGCHIRMIDYNPKAYLKSLWKNYVAPVQHPYTLSTLAMDDSQKLIVRKGAFELSDEKRYLLTGAYLPYLRFIKQRRKGNSRSLLFKIKAKRCLIVVGGSAISYALPVMRVLNYNGCVAKIIWVVRDYEDIRVLNYYQNFFTDDDCIDIFITGKYAPQEMDSFIAEAAELRRRRSEQQSREQSMLLNADSSGVGLDGVGFDEPVPSPAMASPPVIRSERVRLMGPHKSSYGSLLDEDLELGLSPKERSKNLDRRRNSTSSLRNKAVYSFTEENQFENVDVDLDRSCSRRQSMFDPHSEAMNHVFATEAKSSGATFAIHTPSLMSENLNDYWILSNTSCRVEFGRPKLGVFYYNWCVKSSCIGPLVDLQTGESLCCNEIPVVDTRRKDHNLLKYKKSNGKLLGTENEDELFLNERFIRHRNDRLNNPSQSQDKIWVVAAGPVGLVNNVNLWARDCGFHFHAESFSI